MSLNLKIDRKKVENFWYYYKIHVIASIFLLIILVITLKDCASNVAPDFIVSYAGRNYIPSGIIEQVEKKLTEMNIIKDLNGDGKINLVFQTIMLTDQIQSEQDIAAQQKVTIAFITEEAQVFIVDQSQLKKLGESGAFEPIDDLAQNHGIDKSRHPEIYFSVEGKEEQHIYGIPLEDNNILKDAGLDTKDTYIAVKAFGEYVKDNNSKKVEKIKILRQMAYEIIEEIIKHNQ